MKTLKITLLFIILSCFTFSCSSDDSDSTNENKIKIIGTWKFTSSTTSGVLDTPGPCELNETLVFTSNQVIQTFYSGVNCSVADPNTFTYSINENTYTQDEGDYEFDYQIVTLNATTFTFRDSGVDDGVAYNDTYTYTKQ